MSRPPLLRRLWAAIEARLAEGANPDEAARAVAASVSEGDLRLALRHVLVGTAHRSAALRLERASAALAEASDITDTHAGPLDCMIQAGVGCWKPLGRCLATELRAIATRKRAQAAAAGSQADRFTVLARAMERAGVLTVDALSPTDLSRILASPVDSTGIKTRASA